MPGFARHAYVFVVSRFLSFSRRRRIKRTRPSHRGTSKWWRAIYFLSVFPFALTNFLYVSRFLFYPFVLLELPERKERRFQAPNSWPRKVPRWREKATFRIIRLRNLRNERRWWSARFGSKTLSDHAPVFVARKAMIWNFRISSVI